MGRETMTDIKPVAEIKRNISGQIFIDWAIQDPTLPNIGRKLFTADALRAAQVQVLRQAIDEIDPTWEGLEVLRRIADELEAGK